MEKYTLSKNISIASPDEDLDADMPLKYRQDHFILTDQLKDRDYLINQTIKYFIEKFTSPKTLAVTIREIAEDIGSDETKIQKQCADFFSFLCKRKFIVPENCVEQTEGNLPLFKVGDHVADLCISEIISSRKFTDIYLAIDKSNSATYVIKLLNSKKVFNPKKYKKELLNLKHEFAMLQKMKNIPSICQAHSFHQMDNQYAYIILEHIKGMSLPNFLKQTAHLTDFDSYTIIENMLRAFSCLHESKIVHGDIHPSNIMVYEDKRLKIIDLGLSIAANVEKDEVVRMGGVLYYMPPERINISSANKFSKEPDFYSDVYQLGLIMYFIFHRKEPFFGFIWEELSENIKENKVTYPVLSFLNTPVQEQIIKIIQKCISKKPTKRYSNATAILEDYHAAFKKEAAIF